MLDVSYRSTTVNTASGGKGSREHDLREFTCEAELRHHLVSSKKKWDVDSTRNLSCFPTIERGRELKADHLITYPKSLLF